RVGERTASRVVDNNNNRAVDRHMDLKNPRIYTESVTRGASVSQPIRSEAGRIVGAEISGGKFGGTHVVHDDLDKRCQPDVHGKGPVMVQGSWASRSWERL